MKKLMMVKFAVAALLAVGSVAQAQDDTIPTIDETPVADIQASVSDNVVAEGVMNNDSGMQSEMQAVPMQAVPMHNGMVYGTQIGAGCVGCGQSTGGYSPMATNYASPCNGCGSPCGVQTAVAFQPASPCCGGISQVGYNQPIYQDSVIQPAQQPVVSVEGSVDGDVTNSVVSPAVVGAPDQVTEAPMMMNQTYAPVQSGCSSCGGGVSNYTPMTSSYAPTSYFGGSNYTPSFGNSYFSGCNNCPTYRGRLRGRFFRNR